MRPERTCFNISVFDIFCLSLRMATYSTNKLISVKSDVIMTYFTMISVILFL